MAKYLDENGLQTLWGKITNKVDALKSDIPTKVSELTNDSGFTTNKGTVTSVAVKMNGTTKGTVTSSGIIDLGTVITSLPSFPDYDNEGIWHDGEILVATSQFSIGNSGIDIDNVITTSDTATSSTYGVVKLGSDTVQSTSANSVTSTSSRTYAVQKNSNGQLVVNVPWSATSVTIPSNLVLYNSSNYAYGATGSWEFYQKDSTSNKCNIVYGTVSINKSSFYNQSITFAKSLPSSNYSVILTATISNNTASREVFTSVYSRSTTGFVCNGHMGNTSYKITSLHYIAIYNS